MGIVHEIEDGETGGGDRPKLDVVIVDSGGFIFYMFFFFC
jgi:hypothetical protein